MAQILYLGRASPPGSIQIRGNRIPVVTQPDDCGIANVGIPSNESTLGEPN